MSSGYEMPAIVCSVPPFHATMIYARDSHFI